MCDIIIGIVCDFVLNPPHEAWISDKINSVVQRGIDKHADFIVMSYIGASVIGHLPGQSYYVVSPIGSHDFERAICTFKANVDLLIDLSDLIIVISNGQAHTEWDKIRASDKSRLEINYLSRMEKKYERIL